MACKGRGGRCLGDAIAALPEDVIYEVLSRVGNVKDLFMLALTCRRWLRRFTDPAFLRGLWGVGHRARLHGFFFQRTRRERTTFLPAPGSPLRAQTSVDDDTFSYAEPLAARHGIVLVQLNPRTLGTHLLGICNPITGERHILPPLTCSGDLERYAIITAADSDLPSSSGDRFAFSQLLLTTTIARDTVYEYLHSYSAATRSWSAPTTCVDKLNRDSLVGERSAVVHQGAAHWLRIDRAHDLLYKVTAEVDKYPCRVSLTKLPQVRVGGSPLLCISGDGKLSVACVYLMHLTVWTQHSNGGEGADEWLRTAVIRIPTEVPNRKYPRQPRDREKWFHLNRGSMLVLYRSSAIFVLDLDNKVMEKIMDDCLLPRFSDVLNETKSVAYEMDLVEFFLLHLGARSK